jgi:hypothetical protein
VNHPEDEITKTTSQNTEAVSKIISNKLVYEKKINAQETRKLFSIYSSASDQENTLSGSDQKGYLTLYFSSHCSLEKALVKEYPKKSSQDFQN